MKVHGGLSAEGALPDRRERPVSVVLRRCRIARSPESSWGLRELLVAEGNRRQGVLHDRRTELVGGRTFSGPASHLLRLGQAPFVIALAKDARHLGQPRFVSERGLHCTDAEPTGGIVDGATERSEQSAGNQRGHLIRTTRYHRCNIFGDHPPSRLAACWITNPVRMTGHEFSICHMLKAFQW